MASKLFPASNLPALMEIALRSRLDVQALFQKAGIDADMVGRADCYVRVEQIDTVLRTAFSETRDPLFGLHVGRDNHYGNLDIIGNLMAASASLDQGLALLFRYKDLLVPYLGFALRHQSDAVALEVFPHYPDLAFTQTRTHNELVVATIVAIGRSLTGGRFPVREAAFRHPAPPPPQLNEYRAFFQCPLVFEAPCNAVLFDEAALTSPLPGAYPDYRRRLERAADRLLGALTRAAAVSLQVRERLYETLGQGAWSVEKVASSLNMTTRTLQRRLRQEGLRFADLRDQVRHEHACRKLVEPCCDMQQLTQDLGFSDIANFYHAFRRWQGCAPGEYRRRQLTERARNERMAIHQMER
ncbi:AraC family transcriptional regulator ligand-binding domain-containing protein [Alloalcanivorax xenomutans]|uniref:AraC family transcriptional regulator n=1 Tax=Alloalcanivorax xenomutans TaxID=1094342 RepID=UPI002934118F|nr:AraC family transcriptional regulator ligand-binding domain-containing protein [Alloalcanivorax xenomutans]WOD30268.1 AraC family transcriptional regulator ligand-binding domain-containing protein [Alloalcanivorax xenomutans]